MEWFQLNVKGMANILKREGLPGIGRELVQNAFDVPGATEVRVTVSRDDQRTTMIECVDNGSGFEKLADAYTLFNPSIKANNPELRGRFNVGEKFSIAQAASATIATRKGTIEFLETGKRQTRYDKKFDGTCVRLFIAKSTVKETTELIESLRVIQRPSDRVYYVNDERVEERLVWDTVSQTLPTDVIDDEQVLQRRYRKTQIKVLATPADESSYLYEMGIPVCEIPDPLSYDVQQVVPQNLERNRTITGYLKLVRAASMAWLLPAMRERDELQIGWLTDALGHSTTDLEHVKDWAADTWGQGAIMYDARDVRGDDERDRVRCENRESECRSRSVEIVTQHSFARVTMTSYRTRRTRSSVSRSTTRSRDLTLKFSEAPGMDRCDETWI